jgi:sugar lactone lactonase YvrE
MKTVSRVGHIMKNMDLTTLALVLLSLVLRAGQTHAQSSYTPYTFTTLAGNAGYGIVDGRGEFARFWHPCGAAVDRTGNIYVADYDNFAIRKVTPAGEVTTLAGLAGSSGSLDGTGSTARFGAPHGVAVDSAGNVYVADVSTIRKVTPAGVVTTFAGLAGTGGSADGTGSGARFGDAEGVAVDGGGNVYVADSYNHTIRKVTPGGVVTTLAGSAGIIGSSDGTGSAAQFYYPQGVAVDNAGNVYVADTYNHTIRKVTSGGVVTTLAGLARFHGSADGTGGAASFYYPYGVAVDSARNVYVADTFNSTIRRVTPAGAVTTLAGLAYTAGIADGTGSAARFSLPQGAAVDSTGNVYVADTDNSTIRKVSPGGVVTTLAGLAQTGELRDDIGTAAQFYAPYDAAVERAGDVYVADSTTIRKMTPGGAVTTLAGSAGIMGSADGIAGAARFDAPLRLAVDGAGNIFVADTGNYTIRKVTPGGEVTTLAGLAGSFGSADGTGTDARFYFPSGVAVDSAGNAYVADKYNSTIRLVTPAGVVTTLAGLAGNYGNSDGTGSAAQFYFPEGVAVDIAGNVYVADTENHTIRKMTPTGSVTTLAGLAGSSGTADGIGSAARFARPTSVAVDSDGNLYVANSFHTIRKVTPSGVVTTLAGLASSSGSADGSGSAARFSHPGGLAVDSAGNVYVADTSNFTIRKGFPTGSLPVPIVHAPSLNGAFGFDITGPGGLAVDVESSGDLSHWQVAGTYLLNGGTAHFVNPISLSAAQFYRGHLR